MKSIEFPAVAAMDELHFDQNVLSSLTSKINAGLDAGKSSKSQGGKGRKQDKKSSKGTERQNGVESRHPTRENARGNAAKASLQSTSRSNKEFTGEDGNRKKRLLNGDFKGRQATSTRESYPYSQHSQKITNKAAMDIENDGDLVLDDADSDPEIGGGVGLSDGQLDKDVHDLVTELGFIEPSSKRATKGSEKTRPSKEVSVDVRGKTHRQKGSEDTTNPQPKASTAMANAKNNYSRLLLDPLAEWFSVEIPDLSDQAQLEWNPPHLLITALHERGKTLLEKDNEIFASRNKSASSSHQFYTTIIGSGTLGDKISALTLLIQESPLHNMRALDTLIGLAKKRSRAQAIEVLTALKDLFGFGSLLPPARHLRFFNAQPDLRSMNASAIQNYESTQVAPEPLNDVHLIYWAYEDWLKAKYFEVLQILETWCGDEITHSRSKALDMVFELLRDKPEQEANLLRLLVNKLGDTEKKIASRASYNLLQLQTPHPMMKPNIIAAIESDIIFRQGQNLHAKYYAVTTLNQTILRSDEHAVVRKLLDIYFSIFAGLLSEQAAKPDEKEVQKNRKGEMQGGGGRPGKMAQKKKAAAARKGASVEEAQREKIISAVLTGINRAIPYADTTAEFFEKHLDTLFRITHSSNFNTSIQAMLLIQQLCGSHPATLDRFYRTLYESLLDPRLVQSSKQILYLNLLYRSLKSDLNVKRVQAFAKRLLQVIAMHQPAFACAVIYLVRELEDAFPSLASFIDQPEDNEELDAETGLLPTDDPSTARPPVYDGKKRAPEYSHADRSCLWELDPLLQHFHPSATLFATRLMRHETMPSKPTLESHTLIQFLDRFVYRNAKKHPNKWHGASIMQPLASSDSRGQLLAPAANTKPLVNSHAFASLKPDQVNADEVFFHKYFSKVGVKKSKTKKDRKREDAEDSSGDEGEDEVWQALVDSKPDIEGEDDDVDLDADDFSDDAELLAAMDDDLSDDDDLDFDDDGSEVDGLVAPVLNDDDASEQSDEEQSSKALRNKAAKKRRRELRDLPTFASAEDYAAMVENLEGEVEEP